MSEYRDLTPECLVNNGGHFRAWMRATSELFESYLVMLDRHPEATFRLKIERLPNSQPGGCAGAPSTPAASSETGPPPQAGSGPEGSAT